MKIPAGGTVRVQVEMPPMPPNSPISKVQFELSEPPEGVTLQTVEQEGSVLVLQCDASKAKVGLKGNLIVNVSGERTLPAGNARPQANRQRVPLGTLPAIPFEIVNR